VESAQLLIFGKPEIDFIAPIVLLESALTFHAVKNFPQPRPISAFVNTASFAPPFERMPIWTTGLARRKTVEVENKKWPEAIGSSTWPCEIRHMPWENLSLVRRFLLRTPEDYKSFLRLLCVSLAQLQSKLEIQMVKSSQKWSILNKGNETINPPVMDINYWKQNVRATGSPRYQFQMIRFYGNDKRIVPD